MTRPNAGFVTGPRATVNVALPERRASINAGIPGLVGTSVNVIQAPDAATALAWSQANPDNVYFVAAD